MSSQICNKCRGLGYNDCRDTEQEACAITAYRNGTQAMDEHFGTEL